MKLPLKFHIIIEIKIPEGNPSGIIFMHMFFDEKLFPLDRTLLASMICGGISRWLDYILYVLYILF